MVLVIARRAIPDDNHISRWAPKNRQERDPDTDEFKGLSVAACKLGPDDAGGLSVNWIEHFGPYGAVSKRLSALAFREALPSRRLPPQSAFAYAEISEVKAAAARFDKVVRVVEDPVPGNSGHAEVRHFTDEDLRLLDLLATEVFRDPDIVADMKLPPP